MFIEIITPENTTFSGDAKLIKLPGTNGSFEILNSHAPIISTLCKGEIKLIDNDNKESFYKIESGVVEVSNNNVKVLIEL